MSFTKVFLSDTLTDWVNKTNIISEDVGDLTLLGTVQDSDLVGAINELHDSINQLNTFVDPDTALVTSSATVSGAINELDGARDSAAANMNQLNIDRDSAATNMNQLNIDRDSAALNINQLNADRDSAAININTLNTDRDSSAVAINTLFNRVDSIDNETNAPTGNLADLTDSISGASRNNLVAAINDTYGYATQIDASNVTSNEKIGELVNLNTVNQNTVIDAINELHDSIDGIVSGNGGIDITHVDGIIVSHADTSSQADVSNSGTTFLQSVTFDSFGHTLSITSNTVSDASTSIKGIASFSQNDFSVTSGVVTVKQDGISYTQIDKVANPGDGEVLSYSAIDGKLKFVAQTGGGGGGDLVNVNQAAPDISGGLIGGDSVNISIEDDFGYWELEVFTDSVREVSGTAVSTLVVDADTDIIDTANIKDNAVTTVKIATDAVTLDKIANNAIDTVNIIDNAVTTVKVANNAVTTVKIANDAVTIDKIANNAVDSAQIVNSAVGYLKLDTTGNPGNSEVLSYNAPAGRMAWVTLDSFNVGTLGGLTDASSGIIVAQGNGTADAVSSLDSNRISNGAVAYDKLKVVANPGNDEVLSYSASDGKLKWVGQTGGSSTVNVGNVAPAISGGTFASDTETLTIDDSAQAWFLEVFDSDTAEDITATGAGSTNLMTYSDTIIPVGSYITRANSNNFTVSIPSPGNYLSITHYKSVITWQSNSGSTFVLYWTVDGTTTSDAFLRMASTNGVAVTNTSTTAYNWLVPTPTATTSVTFTCTYPNFGGNASITTLNPTFHAVPLQLSSL